MIHSRFLILLALASAATAVAAPVRAGEEAQRTLRRLTLGEALRLAEEHSPAVREARERLVEQEGRVLSAVASSRPLIEGFGNYVVEDDRRLNSFGSGTPPDDTTWNGGVRLRQPLYYGGRLGLSMDQQEAIAEALRAAEADVRMRVATEVHRHYLDALLASARSAVQQESLALLEQQLELARNRFDAGATSRFEVMQAEVRVASAKPPLIRARNEYRLALEDLRATIGLAGLPLGPDDIALVDEAGSPSELPGVEEAMQVALARRPDVLRLAGERRAAEAEWRYARRKRLPSVDLLANYTVENDRFSADSSNTFEGWLVGVEASVPLWESGRIGGEIAQAQSRFHQAVLREEQLRLAIEVEVRKALHRAEEAREILATSELVIAQAAEAHRLADNRYRAGSLTQLDVLSAALDLTLARLEHIAATRDYRMQWVELQRAMGQSPRLSE